MTTRLLTEDTFRGYYTRAADNGDLLFTAATSGVKRDGLDIDLAGLSTDNFMRNPVVLWVHDYAGRYLPIGRVTSLTKQESALAVNIHFDDDDPFAQEIKRKYEDGYLNALSIGWETLETDGNQITGSDLLDVSAVPVPGDPLALMQRADAYACALLKDRAAIPPHTTAKAPEDEGWDGPGQVAACDAAAAPLRRMHAWVDSDMDPDTKQAYKIPHHRATGEVVWRGVAAAMARLSQTEIPDADRAGVYAHLAAHYRQFDKEPPELRSLPDSPDRVSGEPPADRPLTRAAVAEQIDQWIALLQEWRDTLVENPEEIPDIIADDPGPLEDLQALLGDSDE